MVLDLGPRGRVAFAASWLALQATLVLTAGERSDHAFGFRMFAEASTIEVRLVRVVHGAVVAAPRGEWSAHDARGQLRHFAWHDRVRDPVLSSVDVPVFASYGVDAQLARVQRALDDVADHIPEDGETQQFRAVVGVRRNGANAGERTLESHTRSLP